MNPLPPGPNAASRARAARRLANKTTSAKIGGASVPAPPHAALIPATYHAPSISRPPLHGFSAPTVNLPNFSDPLAVSRAPGVWGWTSTPPPTPWTTRLTYCGSRVPSQPSATQRGATCSANCSAKKRTIKKNI